MITKAIAAALLMFAVSSQPAARGCRCPRPRGGETTHWIGNLQTVFLERKPYRQLRGTVVRPDGKPLKGALVEVFTRPEYLLIDEPVSKRGRPKQRRVAACRTGADGKFCFPNLPAGKYELRSSSDDTATGWNASQVYVILNPRSRSKKELIVEMTLGI